MYMALRVPHVRSCRLLNGESWRGRGGGRGEEGKWGRGGTGRGGTKRGGGKGRFLVLGYPTPEIW